MCKTVRKSVDIPEKELKKLQLQAIIKGESIKSYLENIIIEAAKDKVSPEKFVNEFNK